MRMIQLIQKKQGILSMEQVEHIVYILECNDRTLYTGYTNNLKKRLDMHLTGKGAKYTRGRGPFQVVYTQVFPTKSEALKYEYKIKQLSRKEKLKLIRSQSKEVNHDANSKKLSR